MVKTYEDANKKEGRARNRGKEGGAEGGGIKAGSRIEERLEDRDYPQLFRGFGEAPSRVQERRQQARDEFDEGTRREIEAVLDFDYEELLESVRDIQGRDLEGLDELGLLRVLVEQMNNLNSQLASVTNQIPALAAIMDDVATSVQDPFGITVSGINDIQDEGVPQPVVQDSDENEINARVFRLRASSDNDEPIWLGDEDVSVGTGIRLGPGEEFPLQLDLTEDQIYMVSDVEGDEIEIMGLI